MSSAGASRGGFFVCYLAPAVNALILGFGVSQLIGAVILTSRATWDGALVALLLGLVSLTVFAWITRQRYLHLVREGGPQTAEERVSCLIIAALGHEWSQASPFPAPRRTGRFAAAQRSVPAVLYALVWVWLFTAVVRTTVALLGAGLTGIAVLPLAILGLSFPLAGLAFALVLLERLLGWIGKRYGEPLDQPSTRYAELRQRHAAARMQGKPASAR